MRTALFVALVVCQIYATQLNILNFGAVGDAKTDNTKAFTKALAACTSAGGCQLIVPQGTFLTNPFDITSNLDFHLEENSVILAYEDPKQWPANPTCLICGEDVNNVSFTGTGTINGQGSIWWANYQNDPRPHMILINRCKDLLFDGPTLENSPMYHIVPNNCTNVEARNINILAPPSPQSHNTDGIDPGDCNNVYIHDCYINNGDDNVAIKDGTQNVVVEDCVFVHGHGASVGSITGGSVKNVTFRNISFNNTIWAVRIKTQPGCPGSVQDIYYQNLNMQGVDDMIIVSMFYEQGCGNKSAAVKIDNVVMSNITGTGTHVGAFNCSSVQPCTNIHLQDINIKGSDDDKFYCAEAYGTATDVSPASCLKAQKEE